MTVEFKIPDEFKNFEIQPLAEVSDFSLKRRTFKERLFSFPWKPLQKFKSVYDPKIYFLTDKKVAICSFETFAKWKRGDFDGR